MSASMSAVFSSLCALDPTAITRAGEQAVLEEAGEQERAEEVLSEAAVDALAGARAGREQAACAVDQHVDRSAAREHGRRERAYVGGVAHVRAQELRRTAGGADRLGRRRAPRLVVPDNENLRPEPGELDRREAPHPA